MIKKITDNIWVKDSHFLVLGCKGSRRMTLVKTSQGLMIHSPVDLTQSDIEQINSIGEVTSIIAPNLFHHLNFSTCAKQFPDATCWAPSGLAEKVKNLPKHKILNRHAPIFDPQEISQFETTGHKLNETLFFHNASQTLITADFLYNYQAEQHTAEKIMFRLLQSYGKPAIPFYHFLAVTNKLNLVQSLNQVVKLPIKRIIMSHGRIIETSKAAQIFRAAWDKLYRRHN